MTCKCGCGLPAPIATKTSTRQGRVKGQPCQYVSGHNSRLRSPGHTIDPQTGCWNWNGNVNPVTGYGMASRSSGGVVRQAVIHRFYYEQYKGPIPDGLVIDHLCRNRRCVNPDHLEAVTQQVNVRRSARYFKESARA